METWLHHFPLHFLVSSLHRDKVEANHIRKLGILGILKPFPKGHDIYKLWNICKNSLKETDKIVDPGFAASNDYVEQIIGAYNALESDLDKYAEVDPDSQHFRYPVDTHGNPIEIDNVLLGELQRQLPELTKRISYNLDGISVGIQTILQEKYDGLAQ